ncbi:MAG: hypothetical protein ACMG57_00880 [Candidatus Dojkabacteria bacterium]
MEDLRYRVRAIILGIAGFISAILVIRILVQMLGGNGSNILIGALYAVSNLFIAPFVGAVNVPAGTLPGINIDALVAIGIYIFVAIALSEIITSFLYDNTTDIIQNFVDGIFKVVEILLFIRIFLDLFNFYDRVNAPGFIKAILALTDWTQGIIQGVPILNGVLNISAIIALIIIVVIDIFTERFLAGILDGVGRAGSTVTRTVTRTSKSS